MQTRSNYGNYRPKIQSSLLLAHKTVKQALPDSQLLPVMKQALNLRLLLLINHGILFLFLVVDIQWVVNRFFGLKRMLTVLSTNIKPG